VGEYNFLQFLFFSPFSALYIPSRHCDSAVFIYIYIYIYICACVYMYVYVCSVCLRVSLFFVRQSLCDYSTHGLPPYDIASLNFGFLGC
jgi:hypothetical protein